jgi:ribosomal protein S18 acetylase RimI-like enzyme
VKAGAPIGGWVITPDRDDPNKTHCTLMIELDFGAYMPEIAIKTAFRNQGY